MEDQTIDTQALGEKIVKVLKSIYDPEIPVDIYELGLIYDVFVMEDKVKSLKMVNDAEVEITFDPPWTQELMSEEAKLELGML
jgi:metal-sulfur cluster biosynthetic enzyme